MTALPRRAFAGLLFALAAFIVLPIAARADDGADAQAFIRGLADKALALVNDKNLSDADRARKFEDLFTVSFDIPEVGKFVLGRHWKNASPDQQKQFLSDFTDFTVLTWSTRFKDYSGISFEVQGANPADEGYWIVDSRIVRTQGEPIPLGWRVHKTGDGWRVVDILVEGASMALTQRQDFAGAIQSNGGKIDALLASMEKKIAELRAPK